jgi:hypothetical protein
MKHRHWTWIDLVLVSAIVAIVLLQLHTIYSFPQPDSARWWGDETGQMLELEAELQTGVAHIPTALGSSLAVTNGFVRGNSWMAAIVYGLPVLIFDGITDVVTVGRTVTLLLSLLLLFAIYRFVRHNTGHTTAGLLAVLLLVSTRSFFIGSHAARLDIAAGLALILIAYYLTEKENARLRLEALSSRWWVMIGAAYILLSTLSIHLLTTGAVLICFVLWRFRSIRLKTFADITLGALAALAVLLAVYGLSGAPPTLFTHTAVSNQFESVAYGLPILRPFSRSVQVANILERANGLWHEAPLFLLVAALTFVLRMTKRGVREHSVRFISGFAVAVFVAWLLFESPALYYYPQVLPIFCAALVISCYSSVGERRATRWATLAIGVAMAFVGIRDALSVRPLAHAISEANQSAIRAARQQIDISPIRHTPHVLAQNPAIDQLNSAPTLRLVTPHFVSFPTSNAPIPQQLDQIGIDFVLLYSLPSARDYSAEYGLLRTALQSKGLKIGEWTGTLFDVDRDYFHPDLARQDTLTLYRVVR